MVEGTYYMISAYLNDDQTYLRYIKINSFKTNRAQHVLHRENLLYFVYGLFTKVSSLFCQMLRHVCASSSVVMNVEKGPKTCRA
jgi:hypothetical protein